MLRIAQIVQAPAALNFMEGITRRLGAAGLDLHMVAPPSERLEQFGRELSVATHGVEVSRSISPLADASTVVRLAATFRQIQPDMVVAHMSKAGVLGMIAARISGVPACLYHNHGMAVFGVPGWRRGLLWLSERVACLLADRVVCISPSLRRAAVAAGICPAKRIATPATGIVGMDASRFDPGRFDDSAHREIRGRYGIPADAPVVGFVGRILHDKGIPELAAAWDLVRARRPDAHLLVVGEQDPRGSLDPAVWEALNRPGQGIHLVGHVADPVPLIAVFDVLALPSHHEGLPTVVLESAAMGVPAVASRIHGIVDAVVDGVTGTLVPVHDAPAVADALVAYMDDPDRRRAHGRAARERILRDFQSGPLHEALFREYMRVALRPEPASQRGRRRADRPAACTPSMTTMSNAPQVPDRWLQRTAKRCLDIAGAATGLVLALPLLAVVAVAVRFTMGAPVLFRQARGGLKGRPFTLLKFRTMSSAVGTDGQPLPDEQRVSRLGRFLRKSSLDELPQLWNVLRGEMSLIGPRPLPVAYQAAFRPEHHRRHDMRPGITGWAQINGRVNLLFSRRFELDNWYVDNFSLLLDLRILLQTVWQVITGRDAKDVVEHCDLTDDLGLLPRPQAPVGRT